MYSIKRYNGLDAHITTLPTECPYCHHTITPTPISGYGDNLKFVGLLRCTNKSCDLGFVANFTKVADNRFAFVDIAVPKGKPREFTPKISEVSPSFVTIYNEAFFAEQQKLLQICGVGYRKALEFLIKDYLIKMMPDNEQEIKDKFLGNCINEFLGDTNIKVAATRAIWLGNDETHYTRKWVDKDLSDLKTLIDISAHWIEMDLLTRQYASEMNPRG